MPHLDTIFDWLAKHEQFSELYAHAREARAELHAEEILEIADDARNDFMEREAKSGETFTALDTEAVLRSRLRIDTRKWLLSKLLPRQYGDKMQIAGDGGGPVIIATGVVTAQDVDATKLIEGTTESDAE